MGAKGVPDRSHQPKRIRKDLSWQELAACTSADPELFFDPDRYHLALEVCAQCPVRTQCTQLGRNQEGVWGGRIHKGHKKSLGMQGFAREPHGTEAACRRHRRAGERPCLACSEAAALARRERRTRV